MADIELVIKIPEESYNILRAGCFICSGERNGKTILQQFCRAIHNGTPLPKGHGRLIDADALAYELKHFGEICLDEAMTIIGADKEEQEGEK